jgi:hypothetical protein
LNRDVKCAAQVAALAVFVLTTTGAPPRIPTRALAALDIVRAGALGTTQVLIAAVVAAPVTKVRPSLSLEATSSENLSASIQGKQTVLLPLEPM